jgi:hypothetical protein
MREEIALEVLSELDALRLDLAEIAGLQAETLDRLTRIKGMVQKMRRPTLNRVPSP